MKENNIMGFYPNHGELHVKRLTTPNPQEDPLPVATIDWSGACPSLPGDPTLYLDGNAKWTKPLGNNSFSEWQSATLESSFSGELSWRNEPGNIIRWQGIVKVLVEVTGAEVISQDPTLPEFKSFPFLIRISPNSSSNSSIARINFEHLEGYSNWIRFLPIGVTTPDTELFIFGITWDISK